MSELTVKQAIEARRSIRRYTEEPISEDTIRELLRQANLAPTPWNVQPTRVTVVSKQEDKDKLMEAAFGQPQVGAAAAVFVLSTDMQDALANLAETVHPGMPEDRKAQEIETISGTFNQMTEEQRQAWGLNHGYTFMAFLILAAQSMGYATSCMLGFEPDKVRELYGLGDHVQLPVIIAMGVPAGEGFPHHRHEVDRFTTFK